MTLQLLVSVTDGFNFTTSKHRSEMTEAPRVKSMCELLEEEWVDAETQGRGKLQDKLKRQLEEWRQSSEELYKWKQSSETSKGKTWRQSSMGE